MKELLLGRRALPTCSSPSDLPSMGMPHPREYAQAPDLVLVAKDGYGVSGSAEGETFVALGTEARVSAGSHGFVSTEPKMNAVCVISGAGIRAGAISHGGEYRHRADRGPAAGLGRFQGRWPRARMPR